MSFERIRATYEFVCGPGDRPETVAIGIAYEQTAELPDDCLTDADRDRVVGQVEGLEAIDEQHWRTVVSFTPELVGDSMVQLLNLLYGNVSLGARVRLASVDWPPSLLEACPGPQHGPAGLRRICHADEGRPLTCAVVKPVGSSVEELAGRCRELALAGVDLIKDDHSLGNQWWAPFYERVGRCQEVIRQTNRQTGSATVYLPVLSATGAELIRCIEYLQSIGCQGATVLPIWQGLDTVREIAANSGLALLGHPSGSGVFFNGDAGIAPALLLGDLYRLAGCDIVNFPRAGGRFPLSERLESEIVRSLRQPLGTIRAAMPAPGGGVGADTIAPWVRRYGSDAVFVVGGSLLQGASTRELASRLVRSARDPGLAGSEMRP